MIMNILSEIGCIGQCLKLTAPLVALILVISIALLAASLIIRRNKQRLLTFVIAQTAVFLAMAATFYLMECKEMLTFKLYFIYALLSTVLIFGILRFYDRIMVKRLHAMPAGNIIGWAQDFVDRLTSAKLYYFDSAIPRAFASERSIFISFGLLELLDDNELKAVLAHESWHILHNSRTPYLKRLAMMAFSGDSVSELESMADEFAAEIAGVEALYSARSKVDKVFI